MVENIQECPKDQMVENIKDVPGTRWLKIFSRCPRDQMVENIKDVPETRWLKIMMLKKIVVYKSPCRFLQFFSPLLLEIILIEPSITKGP